MGTPLNSWRCCNGRAAGRFLNRTLQSRSALGARGALEPPSVPAHHGSWLQGSNPEPRGPADRTLPKPNIKQSGSQSGRNLCGGQVGAAIMDHRKCWGRDLEIPQRCEKRSSLSGIKELKTIKWNLPPNVQHDLPSEIIFLCLVWADLCVNIGRQKSLNRHCV